LSDSQSLNMLISIDKKMDQMIKLLAINLVRDLDQNSKIKTLAALGLTSFDIADYLGISAAGVRMALMRSKKAKSGKGEKSGS
jgi:hypothetical protein